MNEHAALAQSRDVRRREIFKDIFRPKRSTGFNLKNEGIAEEERSQS
jgi:hypothetical protein